MADDKTTIEELKIAIKEFCEVRDWDQYHNAKDLAIGIITEASEVLEHFRFKSLDEVEELMKDPESKKAVSHELSDVLYFVFRLAQMYDIDISEAYHEKMQKNALHYPVEKSKGKNNKYTAYID